MIIYKLYYTEISLALKREANIKVPLTSNQLNSQQGATLVVTDNIQYITTIFIWLLTSVNIFIV